MGKRNRQKRAKQGDGAEIDLRPSVKDLVEMQACVRTLIERASTPLKGVKDEWQNYVEIHKLVENLRELQTKYVMQRESRMDHVTKFMTWMTENGVDTSTVAIHDFKEGLGLRAEKTIKLSELFLKIPRKVMMSVETAKESILGVFMSSDRLLLTMSNVALSLHVLCEAYTDESFWKPYLDILPETYSTPLYFSPDDVELLRGSPVFADVLNQYRSIARQYAYFFKLFQESADSNKLPFHLFTYDDYRWAVSTVMTRQNQIPSSDRSRQVLALIPLWDMCNHTEGQFSTDFNVETGCGECFALRQFEEGQQVYIYYGPRSNADFMLNNGFVYPANQSDRIEIRIGIAKTDPLYQKRCELLSKLSLLPSGRFHLHKGDDPVDSELLAYLRVYHMSEAEIDERVTSRDRIGMLRDFGEVVNEENEKKLWNFLETRCKLLLMAYPQNYKEDRVLLQDENLPESQRLFIQLRYMEKNILQGAVEYIARYVQELEISLQEKKVEALKLADRENRLAKQRQEEIQNGTAPQTQEDDDDDIDINSITALDQK